MRKITMIMLIASLLIIGIFVTVFADDVTTVKCGYIIFSSQVDIKANIDSL